MDQNIKFLQGKAIKLNTKEFCFFCLKLQSRDNFDSNKIENVFATVIHQPISLLCLGRHLKINPTIFSELTIPGMEQVEVNLCNGCEKVVKRFSVLFQELEKIQMEMDFCLEKIQFRISNGAQDAELVQSYSRRMTSDHESLSKLAGIDKLRKVISKQCLNTRVGRYPTVKMPIVVIEDLPNPSRPILVKQEDINGTSEEINFSIPASPCPSSTNEGVDGPFSLESLNESAVATEMKPDPTNKRIPCPSCEKTFARSNGARYHYEAVHLKKKRKCDICNVAVFSRYNGLISHKKTCRQNLQKRSAEEKFRSHYKFPCPICGKRFPVFHELQKHQRHVHAEPNKFSCTHCNKTFKSTRSLKLHRESVHLNKTWNCKYCNKIFRYRTGCITHQKTCPQKPAIKMEASTSKLHRRNFPKDITTGKVLCPLCNEAFAMADAAHRHYDRIHLQRKYKCDICQVAEYGYRKALYRHKKVCRQGLSTQHLDNDK